MSAFWRFSEASSNQLTGTLPPELLNASLHRWCVRRDFMTSVIVAFAPTAAHVRTSSARPEGKRTCLLTTVNRSMAACVGTVRVLFAGVSALQ